MNRSNTTISLTAAVVIFAGAMLLGACTRVEVASELELDRGEDASRVAKAIDSRSLADLARAIALVEKGDPDEADIGYSEVVSSFKGKRYRWEMFLVPALCSEAQCNALPFKNGGRAEGIVAGWMPRLALAPKVRTTLLEKCGGQPQCPFTVEATLTELVASTEKFTSLGLDDVSLISPQ